jgi:hypothetical protein
LPRHGRYELRGNATRGGAAANAAKIGGGGGGSAASAVGGAVAGYVDGTSGSGCRGSGGGCGGGGSDERIAVAPAWLVAMENGLGLKGKAWQYGATPPPAELVHYTCTTQTEAARIWPLRLFGHWHAHAVQTELDSAQRTTTTTQLAASAAPATANAAAAAPVVPAATAAASSTAAAAALAASSAPPPAPPVRLLALAEGMLAHPLAADSWARLNLMHALVGALGELT